jgi:hypothetical protein
VKIIGMGLFNAKQSERFLFAYDLLCPLFWIRNILCPRFDRILNKKLTIFGKSSLISPEHYRWLSNSIKNEKSYKTG